METYAPLYCGRHYRMEEERERIRVQVAEDWLTFSSIREREGQVNHQDIVARHIRKHRAKFVENFKDKYPDLLNGQAIRSHSGRRHSISKFAGAGVSEAFGMAWSQIESRTVYQSYVDLQPEMVYPTIAKFDRKLQRVR